MSWDLALSPYGDLLFGGNKDLMGTSEQTLAEQRVKIRCKIPRGTWVYDESKTLGSNLWKLLNMPRSRVIENVDPFVREALSPMSDIAVEDVSVMPEDPVKFHDHIHIEIRFASIDPDLESEQRLAITTTVTI